MRTYSAAVEFEIFFFDSEKKKEKMDEAIGERAELKEITLHTRMLAISCIVGTKKFLSIVFCRAVVVLFSS